MNERCLTLRSTTSVMEHHLAMVSLEFMDPGLLAIIALAFGVAVGVTFMIVLHAAERHGNRAVKVVSPTIPDGIDQIIDILATAGVVLDPSNNVLRASEGAFALGIIRNQVLAHNELAKLAAKVRRSGEAVTEDLILSRGPVGDGVLAARVLVAPLGTRFILVLIEDRTEAMRLDDVRRDFVANISHELKTPIASVSLLSEAIGHASKEPEQVRKFAKRLGSEANRLVHITNEIIELSRLQAQETKLPTQVVDVDSLVERAADDLTVIAQAKDIDVIVKAKSGAKVYADGELIVVAIHNLISNAVTYSGKRDSVGVATRIVDGLVEISVTDRGIGIERADHERIFERFYRVDQARARNTGGTGLGLSIVKHTVQNLGGDVRVWSQPGFGSTFTIRLPLAEDTEKVAK